MNRAHEDRKKVSDKTKWDIESVSTASHHDTIISGYITTGLGISHLQSEFFGKCAPANILLFAYGKLWLKHVICIDDCPEIDAMSIICINDCTQINTKSVICQSPWRNHFRIHHNRFWHFASPIWLFWQMCTCWHTSVCLWQIVVKTCNLHRWLSWKWHYVCRVAMFAQTKQILVHNMYIGSGDSSVSAGLVIERSQVRTPAGVVREFSSSWSTFWADCYLGISSTPVLLQ